MDYYDKIDKVIGQLVRNGKRDFVIYPYGLRGKQVKRVLNGFYGIKEKYIVDSKALDRNPNIITLEDYLKKDDDETIILLSSDSVEYYSEIRKILYDCIDKKRVIDVLSPSALYDKDIIYRNIYEDGDERKKALDVAARQIYYQNVEGNIAEVGVYRGDFSKAISKYLPDRKLFLFDTFEGFDARDILEEDRDLNGEFWGDGRFKNTSVEFVRENIGCYVDMEFRKGYFPETAVGLEDEVFAFVSLDTDLYNPTLTGLEFFWPRMSRGGFIFVHDYDIKTVERAVNEFCRKQQIGFVHVADCCHSVILAKPLL